MLSIWSPRFPIVHPGLLALLPLVLWPVWGRALAWPALWALLLCHGVALVALTSVTALLWRRRERSLARRAETQLVVMAARAERALQRGEVAACPCCQRPMRNRQDARCLFCGTPRLPSLR